MFLIDYTILLLNVLNVNSLFPKVKRCPTQRYTDWAIDFYKLYVNCIVYFLYMKKKKENLHDQLLEPVRKIKLVLELDSLPYISCYFLKTLNNTEVKLLLVISYQLLVTSYQLLVTSYYLLVTSHQLLVSSQQLLVTSDQFLVTSHQSLVIRYQLLVTSYQSLFYLIYMFELTCFRSSHQTLFYEIDTL